MENGKSSQTSTRGVTTATLLGVTAVAEMLRERIRSGHYDASGKLPDEFVLVRELGVSRTRLRAALEALRGEGLVVRRPGRGTFVPHGRLRYPFHDSTGFASALAEQDRAAAHELISASTWAMDPLSAAEFGTHPGAPMHVIERMTYLDGESLGLATYVVRADLAPSMLSEELCARRLDMRSWLTEASVKDLASAQLLIDAGLADETTAQRLGCTVGAPLLRLSRHFYTADGDLLAYGSNSHRGDRFAYQATRRFV